MANEFKEWDVVRVVGPPGDMMFNRVGVVTEVIEGGYGVYIFPQYPDLGAGGGCRPENLMPEVGKKWRDMADAYRREVEANCAAARARRASYEAHIVEVSKRFGVSGVTVEAIHAAVEGWFHDPC